MPQLPSGSRVYAIGDIHGCADEFAELLELISEDNVARPAAATTELVLLGDLIDRGPDSARVIEMAMTPLSWATTTCLQGNHEAAMLQALAGNMEMLDLWCQNGGRTALRSWGLDLNMLEGTDDEEILEAIRAAVPTNVIDWLLKCGLDYQVGDYYFVHAGVRPRVQLDQQVDVDKLWIRGDFLKSRRNHGAMIVHGHTISEDIDENNNRVGIDTGAYATGRLTAIGLEGSERWYLQTKGHDWAALDVAE